MPELDAAPIRFTLTLNGPQNRDLSAFQARLTVERGRRVSAAEAIREALRRCVASEADAS